MSTKELKTLDDPNVERVLMSKKSRELSMPGMGVHIIIDSSLMCILSQNLALWRMCTCSLTSVLDGMQFCSTNLYLMDNNCTGVSSPFCIYNHCSFVHNLYFVRLLPMKNKAITTLNIALSGKGSC
ncbi:hypothetical protein BDR07DRAFT_1000212 [Suillus spraguei]|nr:hypothetical protein BDR07DRAFT_1000212 [Suillus spraguei]